MPLFFSIEDDDIVAFNIMSIIFDVFMHHRVLSLVDRALCPVQITSCPMKTKRFSGTVATLEDAINIKFQF